MSAVLRELRAVNTHPDSENRMHDDTVARRYGFAGGLVPGATVFAWAASAIVAERGEGWLDDGAARVRLVGPAYDGDRLQVVATDRDEVVEVRRGDDVLAIVDLAPAEEPQRDVAAGSRSGGRYPPSVEALAPRPGFDPLRVRLDPDDVAAYAALVDETVAPLAGGGRVHPGWMLNAANVVLADNVALGPWIHVESTIRFLGPAPAGVPWEARARVASAWERSGHVFCDLDVELRADDTPAAAISHRAIVAPRATPGPN